MIAIEFSMNKVDYKIWWTSVPWSRSLLCSSAYTQADPASIDMQLV